MNLTNPNFPSASAPTSDLEPVMIALRTINSTIRALDIPAAKDEIEVTNLDQIRLYLRQELSRAIKPLLDKVNIDLATTFRFPKELKVSNLQELANLIRPPQVEIPRTASPTAAPTVIQNDPLDLDELLKALDPLKYLSDRPDKPIAVRMSDGKKFMKAVKQLQDGQDKIAFAVSNSSGLDSSEFRTITRDVDDLLGSYKVVDTDDDASPNYYGFVEKRGGWYILKETIAAGANTYRYAGGGSAYTTNWTGRAALIYDYFDAVF